jgi:hypothetical protein
MKRLQAVLESSKKNEELDISEMENWADDNLEDWGDITTMLFVLGNKAGEFGEPGVDNPDLPPGTRQAAKLLLELADKLTKLSKWYAAQIMRAEKGRPA